VTWVNAITSDRAVTTGEYVKIYGSPNAVFQGLSYTAGQKLIFAKVNTINNYLEGEVVNYDGTNLTFYVTDQSNYYTNLGLSMFTDDTVGGQIQVNLGRLDAVGPTGVSVTGITGYENINSETTGIQFLLNNNTSSSIFSLPVGPTGPMGSTQSFRMAQSGVDTDSVSTVSLGYAGQDFWDLNVSGAGNLAVTFNSGTLATGQVFMALLRNSGQAGTVGFGPANQIYYVNSIPPAFPGTSLAFNIYTFQRGFDYNNHPVYYCTYAANYPALN